MTFLRRETCGAQHYKQRVLPPAWHLAMAKVDIILEAVKAQAEGGRLDLVERW
jgi:hypothetical protein